MNNNENLKEKEEKLINGDVEEIKKDINKILLKSDNYFNTLENKNIRIRTNILKFLILIIIILIILIFLLLIFQIKNLILNLL
jgi:hypothetical protein